MVTSFVRLTAKAASSSASTLNRKLPSGCSKPAGKARRASACSDGNSPIGAVFPNGSGIGCGCFLSTAGQHTALFPVFPLGGPGLGPLAGHTLGTSGKHWPISYGAAFQMGPYAVCDGKGRGGCGLEKRLGERGRIGRFAGRPLPLLVPFRKDSRWPDGTRSRA